MTPTKLYSKQHDSYCTWNGVAYENDGKVAGAYFYGLNKAKNNGFEPVISIQTAKETYKPGVIVTSASGKVRSKFKLTGSLKFGETNKNNIYCDSKQDCLVLIYDDETAEWAKIH